MPKRKSEFRAKTIEGTVASRTTTITSMMWIFLAWLDCSNRAIFREVQLSRTDLECTKAKNSSTS